MAGMRAAMALDGPVTVVQRGWRLGGKGASHFNDGRIEEHGLHVWLGYYDNAFKAIGETGFAGSHRETIDALFMRSDRVGLSDQTGDTWLARFSGNDLIPGEADTASTMTVTDFASRAGGLLTDLLRSSMAAGAPARRPAGVRLSGSPRRHRTETLGPGQLIELVDTALITAVDQALRFALVAGSGITNPMAQSVIDAVAELRTETSRRARQRPSSARLGEAVDLVLTSLIGIYRDQLATHPDGFAAINHLDFREWLVRHGAAPATLAGGLLKGMYDLVFGYRRGDRNDPAFEAGTGLLLAGRFFFDYKGSLFWKMRGGMGESVFVPMYRALEARGAEFRFFHRLERLHFDDAGTTVEAVELGRQARLAPGVEQYRPLVSVRGRDVFPAAPLLDQLDHGEVPLDLESHEADRSREERVVLTRGADFDKVILAVSIGMVPHVCPDLVERDPRWRAMVQDVATVATQSLQLWTGPDAVGLGWEHPGATVAGYESPFDTYADMTHLTEREVHEVAPGSIAYFCSALDELDVPQGEAAVRANAAAFLDSRVGQHWPCAVTAGGFDWSVLAGADGRTGTAALETQYYRANTDPSDRYVQSLPGTGRSRLRPDDSGVDNLFLAGDWVDSGLNAGCIEAAAIAGLQAANAAMGRPLCEGVLGGWRPVGHRAAQRGA